MIKSMTSFAKAEQTREGIFVQVTMRSCNARFLDIVLHSPDSCLGFEDQIRQILADGHQRGRIDVRIHVQMEEDTGQSRYEVDVNQAAAYYQALCQLSENLGMDLPDLNQVLAGGKFINAAPSIIDEGLLKTIVLETVKEASLFLDQMRSREGESLFFDLSQRIQTMEEHLRQLETLAEAIPALYKNKLQERLARLLDDAQLPIDPVRLAQEVAILSDKSDVTEEITRLHSHIDQFREILETADSQGPKLNFLLQEFLREFNTIGSKAGHSDVTRMVVDCKSDLEKIREQVQNIE